MKIRVKNQSRNEQYSVDQASSSAVIDAAGPVACNSKEQKLLTGLAEGPNILHRSCRV